MSDNKKLTQCVIEGHSLKFYKQVAVNSFDAKCQRCDVIIHLFDATYYKRLNGEYNL